MEPQTVLVNIEVSHEQRQALRHHASAEARTIRAVVLRALKKYFPDFPDDKPKNGKKGEKTRRKRS